MANTSAVKQESERFLSMFNALHQGIRAHGIRVGICVAYMAAYMPDPLRFAYMLEDNDFFEALRNGGAYHDIGKGLLSKSLGSNPDVYNDVGREILYSHPRYTEALLSQYAEEIFTNAEEKKIIMDMGKFHHERFDGTGYPFGLKENDIPFAAQLCAVANDLDLASTGKFKDRICFSEVVQNIIDGSGTLYSPEAAMCFLKAQDEIKNLYYMKKNKAVL